MDTLVRLLTDIIHKKAKDDFQVCWRRSREDVIFEAAHAHTQREGTCIGLRATWSALLQMDKRGRPRQSSGKYVRDYLIRTYGMKSVADKALVDMLYSLQERLAGRTPDGELHPRLFNYAQMLGLCEDAWADAKVDFYIGFIARVLAIDKGMEGGALSRKPTEADASGPANMNVLLGRDEIPVRQGAVTSVVECMIAPGSWRKQIVEEVQRSNKIVVDVENGKKEKMVNADELMDIVIEAYDAAFEERMQVRRQRRTALFKEWDDNGNGLLDFGEFCSLIKTIAPQVPESRVMDAFDEGIQAASEEKGEEMDSITMETFVTMELDAEIMAKLAVKSFFVNPCDLIAVAQVKQEVEVKADHNKRAQRRIGDKRDAAGDRSAADQPATYTRKPAALAEILIERIRENFIFSHLSDDKLNEAVRDAETPHQRYT